MLQVASVKNIILALLVVVSFFAADAYASMRTDMDEMENKLQLLDQQVREMRGRYVNPLRIESERNFQHRWSRAMFLYKSEDYINASVILSDLMEFPKVKDRKEYYDLHWYLGDCLTRAKNYMTARRLLEKVVAYGNGGEFYKSALLRLIEIAVDLEQFDEAEGYYKKLKGSGYTDGWDLIQYAYAKSLQKKGKLERALRTFKDIQESSDKYLQARYFVGVVQVQLNKLDDAYNTFDSVRKMTEKLEDQSLYELSTLACARILFELGKYKDALSLYRLLPVSSKFFDQAYYEIAWIYIKEEKYGEAANALDMMLLAFPDSIYAPDSQVLKGNIHLMEGRYIEADTSFSIVINKYASVVEIMDRMLEESRGKEAEVIREVLFGGSTKMPPVVMAWLSEQRDIADALAVSSEVQSGKLDSEESAKIISALQLHLNQESKANLFPPLREGRDQAVEVNHQLTNINAKLNELSEKIVGDRFTDAERKELEKVQKRRRELEKLYNEIPKTMQARYERRARQIETMQKLESEIYNLTLQMKIVDEVVEKIVDRQMQLKGNPNVSKRYMARVTKEIEQVNGVAREMARELRRLKSEVNKGIEESKIGDNVNNADEQIRLEMERALKRERELLDKMRKGLADEDAMMFDRIQRAKLRSDRLESDVRVFFRDLEALVAERVKDFMKQVNNEEKILADYNNQLSDLKKRTEEMATRIAKINMHEVRDHFYNIYLKANVGVIDISWQKRQNIREKIEGLLEARGEEKDQLNRSFEGLR